MKEFKKCVAVNEADDRFWADLRMFVNLNFNSVIKEFEKDYPQLSDAELNFICLMCCDFSNVEIMICMGYTSGHSVYNKKVIIAKKMGIGKNLEIYLREKLLKNVPKKEENS